MNSTLSNIVLAKNLTDILGQLGMRPNRFTEIAKENEVDLEYSHVSRILRVIKPNNETPSNITLQKLDELCSAIRLHEGFEGVESWQLLTPDFFGSESSGLANADGFEPILREILKKGFVQASVMGWAEYREGVDLDLLSDLFVAELKKMSLPVDTEQ